MARGRLTTLDSLDKPGVDVAGFGRLFFDLLELLVVPDHSLVMGGYVFLVDQPHVVMTGMGVPHY